MQKLKTQSKTTIELTPRGVFQVSTTPAGDTELKIARQIRLRAIGKRESDAGPSPKSGSEQCTVTIGQSFLQSRSSCPKTETK